MAGIIEDHEERLQGLEKLRRDVSAEVSAKITQFENDLGGQARRLSVMETHHTSLQHNEIEALGRRIHQVETSTVTKLNDVALTQEALGVDTRAWVEDLKTTLREEFKFTCNQIVASQQHADATVEAQRVRFHTRITAWETWHAAQGAWNALPWWKRWWKRLRGERP